MTKTLSRSELRRAREREYRYRTILDAAESLFAHRGFLETSVEQIADKAEVSVGTVYFYFKNKEALLDQLFDESLFLLRSILGKKFEKADTPEQGIEMAGQAFFDEFCLEHTHKALILFREATSHGKKMENRRKKMSETISADLSKATDRLGREAGYTFRSPESPEIFANCILGVYEKMALHFLIDDHKPGQQKAMARDAVEFTIGGLARVTTHP
ncbi:MAG: helix-turn-helix transcriptional regulator [Desulfobacter sp.]|nr:MAG: helix-turn-helix transcriptional regulator [Desulfobacter sp.]